MKEKDAHLVLYKLNKMTYNFIEFTVKDLVSLIDTESLNLNPDYQRNYIWTSNDQKYLIDTIIKGFPLPSFFVYLDSKGKYEMVDGQQRSKTIYRFIKGAINSSKATDSKYFKDLDPHVILTYRLPFIVITNIVTRDYLREFYVLINKKGVHLNTPEVNKSEYFNTLFLKLADDVLDYQNLIELNLFTDISIKRMNDRAFIEELLSYLKVGIQEKKKAVDDIYKSDITQDEYQKLRKNFTNIIDKMTILNQIKPISNTRYKQKNDFYTFFTFINENIIENQELLNYQYKILLILDRIDKEGRQFIRPTNEDCDALKQYATYCVSQSNSSNAREKRLQFFNSVLKNIDISKNDILTDVINYLSEIYNPENVVLVKKDKFNLIDVELLN